MNTNILMRFSFPITDRAGRREKQKNGRNNIKKMNLNKMFFCISAIAAIAVLAFAFAFAAAGSDGGVVDQNGEGVTVAASAVTTSSINYQGRLTDSAGEPLSGSYTMTFRLYEVASGGTARDTDSHSVDVTDGLFNTEIDFDPEYFDGRGLWLGITVGIDSEMSPRQELRPVPYALSLKPGANIVGASPVALRAESTHTSGSGIRGDVTSESGTTYGVVGSSKSPDGYGGYFYNIGGGTGVYAHGSKYGGDFTTNQAGTGWSDKTAGVNATTIYDYSTGVQAHTAGDYSTGVDAVTSGDHSLGVQASTTGENSPGVDAYTTGDSSDGVSASAWGGNSVGVRAYSVQDYGVYGKGKSGGYFTTNQAGTSGDRTAGLNVTTAHQYSYGVRASTSGDHSDGVVASTKGDSSTGVVAYTYGDHSTAVYAHADGDNSDGVRVSAFGDNSAGIYAYSGQGYGVYGAGIYGVYGKGDKSGGYFTTYQGGTWDDKTAGVNATTTYDYSDGVYARTTGDYSDGVYAYASGDDSDGVYAHSTKSDGVVGVALSGTGVVAKSFSGNIIEAWDTSPTNRRFYVSNSGEVYADGSFNPSGADVAEYFPVAEDPEPGTVMVIGEDSKLQSSGKAYDTTVAGIVSTAPGVALGTNETGNEGEELIAVAGRVPCKVDATYAPIMPGDLLTTSDTPGHAMKATDPQIGTILGKALEPLDSGTAVIEVLVTLQ